MTADVGLDLYVVLLDLDVHDGVGRWKAGCP
jgi:hypothetical protein